MSVSLVNDKKNRTTQNIRAASRSIVTGIGKIGKQSVRGLGELIGRSKSSAHRLLQAKEKRDLYPESPHWETEAGYAWVRLALLNKSKNGQSPPFSGNA